jgi:hypothetical protein
LTVDELKALVKDKSKKDSYIVSNYTAPLYLANLKLCSHREGHVPKLKLLSFPVLEKQSDLDQVAYD